MCLLSCFSSVQLFVTLWTIAHQATLSMGFSRQEYCIGLPFPRPGDLPNLGIELGLPASPASQVDSLPTEPPGKPSDHPAAAAAKSFQSCPTLCDPIDGSPPGSPVPGTLQARTLGVGCHFLLQCMKVKSESEGTQVLSDSSWPHGLQPTRFLLSWGFPGKNTGVGCHCLLQVTTLHADKRTNPSSSRVFKRN